ncbi:DNA/RNA non-specific endonuclease [Kitasatospora sp. NPDC054795]
MEDGTETAWKNTPRRPMVVPPGYWDLTEKQRARGHLMGRQFGGSGDNLRNLVPLWDYANAPAMWTVEMDIAGAIKKGGQRVVYKVEMVYAGKSSAQARGSSSRGSRISRA